MNSFIVVSIVLLIMLFFNNRENFDDLPQYELPDLKCYNNTNKLSDINAHVDVACQDNETDNRYSNNERITCRNFVERQIFVGNDNNLVCGDGNKIPIKRLENPINSFTDIIDTSMNSSSSDETEFNYPFFNEMKY